MTPSEQSNALPVGEPADPADAEADSQAGDEALPHVDELREDAALDAAVTHGRARLHTRLNDPALRRRLLRYLMVRHGMPEHDAEDVLQDAFVRASGARKWPPENVPLYPWMRRYANYQRLKHQAAGAKREAREQPDEYIDEHALERGPEDERAAGVARVARQLAADHEHHAQTLQMWEARAEGEPIVAIAADADVGEEAAKKRMQRFASAVRERWAEASAAAVAICAAILLYLHTLVPPPVPPPIGIDSQPRPLPTLPAPLGPAAIRREAFRRCVAAKTGEQWNACLAWLDRARQVDPEGEADPDVKELRARADNALDGKAPRREQPLRHPDGPQNP